MQHVLRGVSRVEVGDVAGDGFAGDFWFHIAVLEVVGERLYEVGSREPGAGSQSVRWHKDIGKMLLNPLIGDEKAFIDMIFIDQGFNLGDFVGGVEAAYVGRYGKSSFVYVHVGADEIIDFLGSGRATFAAEGKSNLRASGPKFVSRGDDHDIYVICGFGVVHSESAGEQNAENVGVFLQWL